MDKFYTLATVSSGVVSLTLKYLNLDPNEVLFIEPSAGNGSFSNEVSKRGYKVLAYDIEPEHPSILKQDFLTLEINKKLLQEKYGADTVFVTIGNPPFGFACSQAIKFFNKCAEFSSCIAFICPKTFRKPSVHNKLNKNFHLVQEYEIPDKSFIKDGEIKSVPCVYQIWQYQSQLRPVKAGHLNKYLKIVPASQADFAMRRVGGNAGKILDGLEHSKSSTYFFKEMRTGVKEFLQTVDFENIRNNTAGVRSISQLEIYEVLEEKFNDIF